MQKHKSQVKMSCYRLVCKGHHGNQFCNLFISNTVLAKPYKNIEMAMTFKSKNLRFKTLVGNVIFAIQLF